MSLTNWMTYTSTGGTLEPTVVSGEQDTSQTRLCLSGTQGHCYLREPAQMSGHLAASLRLTYSLDHFAAQAEMRVYCFLSQEDIREAGECYCIALCGDRSITLYQYHEGLSSVPEVLQKFRLPAVYHRGMLGVIWAHQPYFPGVFFRGFYGLSPQSETPQQMFHLFDYFDKVDYLTTSVGEAIGVSLFKSEEVPVHVFVDHLALLDVTFTDPKEIVDYAQ